MEEYGFWIVAWLPVLSFFVAGEAGRTGRVAVGSRESAVGGRQSAAGGRQSAVGSQMIVHSS